MKKINIAITFSCFLIIASCGQKEATNGNLDSEKNAEFENLIKTIKEDKYKFFDTKSSSDEYGKSEEQEDSERIYVELYWKDTADSGGWPATVASINKKGIVKGDLNSDGLSDYLVPYYLNSPPGNACSFYYSIYMNNNNEYRYIGKYENGSSHYPTISLKYVKDEKIYGVWSDAFPPTDESKPDKDVVLVLKGTTLELVK